MVFLLKQSCGAWRVRVPVGGSAGMQRIAALAYLLVWTWREHLRASERTRRKPAREVICLIHEIECHLYPQCTTCSKPR
jgi:hypothetical protein